MIHLFNKQNVELERKKHLEKIERKRRRSLEREERRQRGKSPMTLERLRRKRPRLLERKKRPQKRKASSLPSSLSSSRKSVTVEAMVSSILPRECAGESLKDWWESWMSETQPEPNQISHGADLSDFKLKSSEFSIRKHGATERLPRSTDSSTDVELKASDSDTKEERKEKLQRKAAKMRTAPPATCSFRSQ